MLIRILARLFWAAYVFAVLSAVSAMVPAPSHNAAGGYVDACGDLPGMVGDDC